MGDVKVLVTVEDDKDMQFLIKAILGADETIDVLAGPDNAKSAVEIVKELKPDLVILDHHIRGLPLGLDAAPEIKEACPSTRILLFTSHNLTVEARNEPAIDRFLNKDDIDQLLPVVQELLGSVPTGSGMSR